MWKWDYGSCSNIADRFVVAVIANQRVKKIFVDEALLKINGQGFSYGWLMNGIDSSTRLGQDLEGSQSI